VGWSRTALPAPIPEEQCDLCLGSCEAELAGEGLAEPGSRIFPKFPKALRDVVFAEPYDTTRASEDAVYLLRWRKPHRTSAVLAIGVPRREKATTTRGNAEPTWPRRRRCREEAPTAMDR